MEIPAMREPLRSIDDRVLSSRERVEAMSRLSLWKGKLFSRETDVARMAALATRLVCIVSEKEFCVSLTLAQLRPTMLLQVLRGRPRRTSSAADLAAAPQRH
jgi:hypothetical protein